MRYRSVVSLSTSAICDAVSIFTLASSSSWQLAANFQFVGGNLNVHSRSGKFIKLNGKKQATD